MAAPSGITWGSEANGYVRIGIYTSLSHTDTQTTLTVETWLWTKYSLHDSSNNYYYNNLSSPGSATTNRGAIDVYTTVDSGAGWSTSNQMKIGTAKNVYTRGTTASTRYLYTKITNLYTPTNSSTTATASTTVTIPALQTYTIAYNANGATGTTPTSHTKSYGYDATIKSASTLSKTGYSFVAWNTKSDGTGTSYSAGAQYSPNANITLYAIWRANTYNVTFNANGGTGAPSGQTKTHGQTLTLTKNVPSRTNYNFVSWNTKADGKGTSYSPGGSFTANANTTLYAIWELAWTKPKIYKLSATRREEYLATREELASQKIVGTLLDGVKANMENVEYDVYVYTDADGQQQYYTIIDSTLCLVTLSNTTATVEFEWETSYDVTSITVAWESADGSDRGSTSIIASGKAGSVEAIVGGCMLNPERAYTVTVTVADGNGSSTVSTTLSGIVFPIDVYKEGAGIAFGKAAEIRDTAEFAWAAKFNTPVSGKALGMDKLPVIPNGSDLNNYRDPGCYAIYRNADAATISYGDKLLGTAGGPPARAGRLEVWSATGEGVRKEQWSYLRQRFIPYNDSNPVWERHIARGADNEWVYNDWWPSSLTPAVSKNAYHEQHLLWGSSTASASGLYMTGGQSATLTENVSDQPNGIVLVFSAYETVDGVLNTNFNWQCFFVPKLLVTLEGTTKSHVFDLSRGKYTRKGTKYLYIYDDRIEGHDDNKASGTSNGITFDNSKFVLRYVIGV